MTTLHLYSIILPISSNLPTHRCVRACTEALNNSLCRTLAEPFIRRSKIPGPLSPFPSLIFRLHKCSHSYRNSTRAEIIHHPNMWVQMLRWTLVLSAGTVYSPACFVKDWFMSAGLCAHKFHATSYDPFSLPIASHSSIWSALCHHLYGNGPFFWRAVRCSWRCRRGPRVAPQLQIPALFSGGTHSRIPMISHGSPAPPSFNMRNMLMFATPAGFFFFLF